MQPQVQAELCSACNGKGSYSTGKVCDECKGSGAIGKDGTNEYFLQPDPKGNLIVSEIKTQSALPDTAKEASPSIKTKPSKYMKWLFLLIVYLLYAGFVGLHFIFIKNQQAFSIVTVVVIGFSILFIIYNTNILSNISTIIVKMLNKKEYDLSMYIEDRKKEYKQKEI
jgi:hypothetical protein